MNKIIISLIVILGTISCSNKNNTSDAKHTPNVVEINGHLSVKGVNIVNEKGEIVSFAGNSFFWSNQYWRGHDFYNKDVVKWLKEDWNSEIVRCAMAIDAKVKEGYHEAPEENIETIEKVIDASIELGLYVIIDWHSHDAYKNEADAIKFFERMARKYGEYPNIIYEIYNEPLKVSWDDTVKPYSENVIAAIRKIDPDNLIIIGTPHWSQDVDIASENPILGQTNIAYTLHFYAASHKQWLINKAQKAIDNGLALFVTEWGTVEADGNGDVDPESVEIWMDFMKKNNLSHCNWAINDKEEGSSIVIKGSSTNGGWKDSELTVSGKLAKKYISGWNK